MGTVSKLRRVQEDDERYQKNLERAELNEYERGQLHRDIGVMRRKDLPLPGDIPWGRPPVTMDLYWARTITNTELRLQYDFDDDYLILIRIHRIEKQPPLVGAS